MIRLIAIFCLVSLSSAALPISESAKSAVLNKHNTARKSADASIPDLVWHDTLAAHAAMMADKCVLSGNLNEGNPYGHNSASANIHHNDVTGVLSGAADVWIQQKAAWIGNNRNWDCILKTGPLESCNSYSQVVWKQSTAIGCAVSHCPGPKTKIVCAYYPAGNVVQASPTGGYIAQNPY